MRKWIYIFIGLLLPLSLAAEEKGGGFDMDEYLYGHVRDSYEWHITTVKGHPVSIPLPVIVASKTGNGFHSVPSIWSTGNMKDSTSPRLEASTRTRLWNVPLTAQR